MDTATGKHLTDIIECGDLLLTYPKHGGIGKMITKLTFGKVNHAMLAVTGSDIFETDGAFFKAKFTPSAEYDHHHVLIIRLKSMAGKEAKVEELCAKYLNSPYSYWDICTNGLFFWLAAPIRKKVVQSLGTKKFMLCSELASRIIYEATGRKEWEDYEGNTPEDMREIALMNSDDCAFAMDYNPEAK